MRKKERSMSDNTHLLTDEQMKDFIVNGYPDIKVIMITAVDDEDIAREAMEAGAVDYVTKPLDLNYLDAVVTFQLAECENC